METIELQSKNRQIFGKKVKQLRQQKVTPLHVFGQGQKSLALQSDTHELERVLARAGETRLITLTVDKEKKSRTTLVREVQRSPLTGALIHVDLYQVSMGEKVEVEIPIVFVGEAPALKTKGNSLDHELNSLRVECLPGKIPDNIEVNIGSLSEPGDAIRVKDITVDPDITVLTNPEQMVVFVAATHVEETPVVRETPPVPSEQTKPTGQ